jgi:hypothetical protein
LFYGLAGGCGIDFTACVEGADAAAACGGSLLKNVNCISNPIPIAVKAKVQTELVESLGDECPFGQIYLSATTITTPGIDLDQTGDGLTDSHLNSVEGGCLLGLCYFLVPCHVPLYLARRTRHYTGILVMNCGAKRM